ncbi:thioredoxin [Clavibacter michiganensis]|uniref:Thioredoxin n=1 Tax=Clavibacter michiganensis TaxID=28447 RepID=A0A2S5VTG5_9MICO|nr:MULTISPECIES: thioredoxin [Clavibacter]PPF67530.1 thioredoxin [Clavibacter michiganensis]
MATTELTAENFESIVDQNGIVVVDFWADWCGPCKQFAPVFDQSSEKHADIVHGKVDTEAQQFLAQQANISAIPTLMIFKDQTLIFSQAGALPAPALESLIQEVRAVDVAALKEQAAAEAAQATPGASSDPTAI